MPNDSKHIQASLSLTPTDWLRLRVAQVPGCRDRAIFVVPDSRRTDRLPHPCACARGISKVDTGTHGNDHHTNMYNPITISGHLVLPAGRYSLLEGSLTLVWML